MIAAQGNDLAVIEALLEAGADVNVRDADGATPLPYEIEHWSNDAAVIWVLVDTV
jgi:ankyrin repeat protein